MTGSSSPYLPFSTSRLPFLPVLFFFALGILCRGLFLPALQGERICFVLFMVLLGAGVFLHVCRGTGVLLTYSRALCLYLCFAILGILITQHHDVRNQPVWYGRHLNDATDLMVRTSGWTSPKARTVFVPGVVTAIYRNGHWEAACGSVNLYVYKQKEKLELPPGSMLIVPNQFQKIENNGNPFHFDYVTYLARQNIYHQAFYSRNEILIQRAAPVSSEGWIHPLRQRLMTAIQRNVSDPVTRSLIGATLLNERARLQQDVWKAYALTGIAHIIAISGMHISIFLGILLFLLRWIRNKRLEWIKYGIAVPVIWFYIALTDFPPSAVRAAVMFTFLSLSIVLRRERNSMNLLCATAFLLLVYNPEWLFDTGVQLSFLAVFSILLFYQPVYRSWQPSSRLLRHLWSIIAVSVAAQIVVFPLVIYYFHQFPVWILLSSVPAAFYSTLLMGGSLLLFTLDFLSVSAVWLGTLLTWLTHGFHVVIFFLAAHTPLVMQRLRLDALDFWITMSIIAGFTLFYFRKRMVFLYGAFICMLFLVGDWIILDIHAAEQQKIVVYKISGKSVVDYFYGKAFRPVHSDTAISLKTKQYYLFPARLGLRAIAHRITAPQANIWRINGRKILLLPEGYMPTETASFPVDVLILKSRSSFRPQLWMKVFHPRLIVLDSSFPRWKARSWKRALQQWQLSVYDVGTQGAWIFPG